MFSDLERQVRECVVPRLNEHGYYYIDNFLGSVVGDCIYKEVRNLHSVGALRDGQLAGQRTGSSKRHLRGDQIAWIRGVEDGCYAIDLLLSLLDKLIILCGGKLENYNIKDRSQVDGGILRIFPEGKSYVVDVEPMFDRLLLFWSDRRNPHEVQPAYSVRYAITVWYFDAEERAEARTRYRNRAASGQTTSFSS
ncbi:egl nine homolog 3 isoform X4 [Carcharodon carcharias]|uniref:egl nine homolog 3 isoform X4 n=1 Tax=Carcharodon carcharias TaxID=13397 RepID=UPI001B7E4A6B|nr:egl nine homolog 3 isoform X4 [Carcharodon carcharias]